MYKSLFNIFSIILLTSQISFGAAAIVNLGSANQPPPPNPAINTLTVNLLTPGLINPQKKVKYQDGSSGLTIIELGFHLIE